MRSPGKLELVSTATPIFGGEAGFSFGDQLNTKASRSQALKPTNISIAEMSKLKPSREVPPALLDPWKGLKSDSRQTQLRSLRSLLVDEPIKPTLTGLRSSTSIVQDLQAEKKEDSKKHAKRDDHKYADHKLEMMLHKFKDEVLLNKLPLCAEHFELLCLQHPSFGSCTVDCNLVVGINLPDTVIYYKGSPIVWYHTQNGSVMKMSKEKLGLEMICEKFSEPLCSISGKNSSSQLPKHQPVAYFLQFVSEQPGEPTKGVKYFVKYLTQRELSSLGADQSRFWPLRQRTTRTGSCNGL